MGAEGFMRMWLLERACEAQVLMSRPPRDGPSDPDRSVTAKVAAQSSGGEPAELARRLVRTALLRRLGRIDPGFRY